MYVPSSFRIPDLEELHAFIATHGFATLVSVSEAGPFATHVPLMIDRATGRSGTLLGHVARANPHWRQFEFSSPSLAIFHGPHAYVSPAWYVSKPAVPTWNYAVVHAYGHPTLIHDPERVARLLDDLVAVYESRRSDPWRNDLPVEFRSELERHIVAFELRIEKIEGKFKLGQNRPLVDQRSALDGLAAEGSSPDLVEFWGQILSSHKGSA